MATEPLALIGTSAILSFVAAYCFQASARLWGRFNFESVLTWVEMVGSYQTSRIGTGNNFTSRMNTENDVVRTEAMTLRVWRARIESVVFGKDDARQVTAMFSTEADAKALATDLMQFARSQSVLVAPFSGEDQARISALNAGEQAMLPAGQAASAAQIDHSMRKNAALASVEPPWILRHRSGHPSARIALHEMRHGDAARRTLLRAVRQRAGPLNPGYIRRRSSRWTWPALPAPSTPARLPPPRSRSVRDR